MKTIIIGNGNINDYDIVREYFHGAYIIACDGGLRHCRAMMITPNIMIGDFDSANKNDFNFFEKLGVGIASYPKRKDLTDMEIAINHALTKGSTEIYIFGGVGNRIDHCLANIHILLHPIQLGVKACLVDENNIITLAIDDIEINGDVGQTISLVPLTTSVLVEKTTNLEYPLEDKVMQIGSSLGISNVMTASTATITISNGVLVVILSSD